MKNCHYNVRNVVFIILFAATISGCGKHKEPQLQQEQTSIEEKEEQIRSAFAAKNYSLAKRLINELLGQSPDANKDGSYTLMLADAQYELGNYPVSYEHYQHFTNIHPGDSRVEYACYKAAHAKFAQTNHISFDTTSTEHTIQLCKSYQSHDEFTRYRRQMEDLQRTCQQRLLDKELYIVNAYINQDRLSSARHRLSKIEEQCDLVTGKNEDKVLFYKAKLAHKEQDIQTYETVLGHLQTTFPNSEFTSMADRLSRLSLFGA